MANARDVNIDIIGHDKTDRATRSAERNIDRLERKLGGVGRTAGRAAEQTEGAFTSIATTLRSTGVYGIAAAVAAGIAASPIIGGAISASITAGGVAGVIGLAAYLQKDNPAVVAGANRLKKTVETTLKTASAPLAENFVRSLDKARESVERQSPLIKRAFAAVQPSIDTLTDGIIGFVEKAAPGFVRMLEKSQPVIDAIANKLPVVGAALGSFFDSIGNSAPDAAVAIGDVISMIALLIIGLGKLLGALSKYYGAWRSGWLGFASIVVGAAATITRTVTSMIAGVLRSMANLVGAIPGMGRIADGMRRAADGVDAQGARISRELRAVQRTIDSLRGKTVVVNVAVRKQQLAGVPGYVNRPGTAFSADRLGTFSADRGIRFAGFEPQEPPVVNAVTTVYLDGEVLKAVARTEVKTEMSRQASRLKTGRRR